MADSILTDVKKVLGLSIDYTAFDVDIIIFINSALSVLNDLGLGPAGGLSIGDSTTPWDALALLPNQLSMAKTYVILRSRMLFDPPTTSYLIEAMEKQMREYEYRLSLTRENSPPENGGPIYPLVPVGEESM